MDAIQTADLPSTCPSCRGPLVVERLYCSRCAVHVEGVFELPALLRLPPDDLEFVLRFVKTSGSLKAVARQYGQSYPTIRNRLNEIIERLGDEGTGRLAQQRQSILDAIAKGTLTVAQAELKLRELTR